MLRGWAEGQHSTEAMANGMVKKAPGMARNILMALLPKTGIIVGDAVQYWPTD